MSSRYPHKPDAGLRYCNFAMTLDEIGRELGITRERARQLENRALTKARVILKKHGFTVQDLLDGDHHG